MSFEIGYKTFDFFPLLINTASFQKQNNNFIDKRKKNFAIYESRDCIVFKNI